METLAPGNNSYLRLSENPVNKTILDNEELNFLLCKSINTFNNSDKKQCKFY